ncbi:hypothetical protein Tco_1176825 [Tanacetum coccineum]
MRHLKYLSEVNSHAYAQKKDAQSHKTTKRYIPVGKKSDSKKPGRQIPNKTTWSMSLLLEDLGEIERKSFPLDFEEAGENNFLLIWEIRRKSFRRLTFPLDVGNKEDQEDFLADRLEEMDDCDDLQLHTHQILRADHLEALKKKDLDCDDEAIASAIFMASLSPTSSINGDIVGLTYDSDILFEVPHYDTYHEIDMVNLVIQEMEFTEHLVSNNDLYNKLTSDINVISYADYMVTIKNDVAQYIPHLEQDGAMILSLIEQIRTQVERCNTVNEETKSVNESLFSKLERYKEKVKVSEEKQNSKHFFTQREEHLDSQMRGIIVDRNKKVKAFKK